MANDPKNLYGLGFSPLSMSNKLHGQSEELVADKNTGLLGILQAPNGAIISATHVARCKQHLTNFVDKCVAENTIGKIYKISLGDELNKVITSGGNLFDNEVTILNEKAPIAFRVDIDFDVYKRANSVFCDMNDFGIRMEFSLIKNTTEKNFYISERLVDVNNKAYPLDYSFEEIPGDESEEVEPTPDEETPSEGEVTPEPISEDDSTKDEDIDMPSEGETGEVPPTDNPGEGGNTNQPSKPSMVYGFRLNTLEIIVPEGYNPSDTNMVIYDILLGLI